MKIILALMVLLLTAPAFAQDAAKAPADIKERMALSQQLHKVRDVKIQINKVLDAMGDGLSQDAKDKYRADMRRVFNYKLVEDASIKSMAEIFTVPELKAMIAFHSKPEGQSATAKMSEYELQFIGALKGALDGALTELKYPKK